MALYKCPECGHEVSTSAKRCPNCGKDLRFAGAGARWRALPLWRKIALVVVLVLIFAWIVADIADSVDEKTPSAAQAPAAAQAGTPAAPTAQEAAPETSTDRAKTIQPGKWFGFATKDLLDRSSRLASEGDGEAWVKFMSQAAAAGELTKFKPGEKVYLEDTAVFSGLVKVRRKGETEGWWTNIEAIRSAPAAQSAASAPGKMATRGVLLLVGKSPKEIAQRFGAPVQREQTATGPELTYHPKSGATIKVDYSQGKAEGFFIELGPGIKIPFNTTAIQNIGLATATPTFSSQNVIRWENIQGLREVSIFPVEHRVWYYLITAK